MKVNAKALYVYWMEMRKPFVFHRRDKESVSCFYSNAMCDIPSRTEIPFPDKIQFEWQTKTKDRLVKMAPNLFSCRKIYVYFWLRKTTAPPLNSLCLRWNSNPDFLCTVLVFTAHHQPAEIVRCKLWTKVMLFDTENQLECSVHDARCTFDTHSNSKQNTLIVSGGTRYVRICFVHTNISFNFQITF